MRKKVSEELPQYHGDLFGLQKREHLARKETDLFKENIVVAILDLNVLNLRKIILALPLS